MEELAMAYSSPASSSTQTPCEIEEIEMDQRSSDGASSSSTAAVDKYDVFINHRGEVKKTFAAHLYRALHLRGLRPFLDQYDLQEGQSFPSQLEAVIRNASVHVAVFSPKYAESRWCLHELLLMRESGAPIIPVFYHVNPAHLRWTDQNKTGVYATSLHELGMKKTSDPQTREEKLRYDPATIQKWRDALSFVADISGFDLNGKFNGDEVHMIDKIVERVGKMIRKPGLYVAKHPTGLNDKVTDFEATVLKQQQAGKIQVAGIVGLGGMGKTTLALELFNRMSSKYNKSFFLSDVREKANKSSLPSVQRELLRGLTQREVDINNIHEGIMMIKKELESAPVLLILDDIDHGDQLEALLPDIELKDVLRPDSFILITSRYKDVLESSGVELKCLSASVEGSSQLSWLKVAASPIIHTSEVFFDEVEYPNLKELILEECINLVEIGTLPKALIYVRLDRCYNLRSIQGLCGLPMLGSLHIKKCNELEELRSVETMVSLKELYAIDCAKLKSIRDLALTKLTRLIVEGCPQLGELEGVECCKSLAVLDVEGCPKLRWDERVVKRLRQKCLRCRLEEPNRS